MATTKMEIKHLKPGKYCVIDGVACKVLDVTTSVPGKHGGAKARLEAVGLIDNKKRSVVKPASSEIEVPIIEKKTGQVVAVQGNTAQIMDMIDYSMFDAEIPEELRGKLQSGTEIIYWVILDNKTIVGLK